MVLHDTHAWFHGPRIELDSARIIAFSGALALNVAALLLLLMPARMPEMQTPRLDKPTWYLPVDPAKPPPQPPADAKVVPPQTPSLRTPTIIKPRIAPAMVDPVLVDDGSLPADPVVAPVAVASTTIAPPTQPIAGVLLEYLKAPPPPYPRDALIAGLQGEVLLQVLVDVDGRPIKVDIQRSSGQRVLDEAARRHVLRYWRFRPAMQDGRAVQALGLVPIDFKL